METDISRSANWRLRKVKNLWFLDTGGKLKRLKVLDDATEVFLVEDIIFADEAMYHIIEENGEVVITEIENIDKKNITSGCQQDDIILHLPLDGDSVQNIPLIRENSEQNEEMRLFAENEREDDSSDDQQEVNHDIGSEEYRKQKGKFWRFIDRIKQFKKKNKEQKNYNFKKAEEPIYEDAPIIFKENLSGALTDKNYDDDGDYACYTSFEEQADHADEPSVSLMKKVTAIFDFDKLTDEEISFKQMDELTVLKDIVSENSEWCYAEHLVTGEKGFVPVAYITQADHALIAQDWWHNIDRDGAIELLTNLHRPGTYLIRPSSSGIIYALSMIVPSTYSTSHIVHYAIKSRRGHLYISKGKQFRDICALVDHYKRDEEGLLCKLEIPAPRQKPVVYPMSIEVQEKYIEIIKSIKIGKFGVLFEGKLCNMFDVTIVTKCKSEVEHFLAEANHLYEFLHSKHLVRVIAVVLEPKPFMIVLLETVQDTLQNYLEKCDQKTISFKRLTNIAAEIAEGMAFLEENSIVHGYLKTENVLICEHNELKLLHPKLINLMKTSASNEHAEGDTEWKWTAPEVVADESVLCTKSDVWSFGVVMYEIITFGGVPYAGLEKEETLQKLMRGYFRQPRPVQCPDEFYNTILQCWHQSPDCRLTFEFLYNYLDDFENTSESEKFLKDYKSKLISPYIYKKCTLKIEKEEQTRGKLEIENEEQTREKLEIENEEQTRGKLKTENEEMTKELDTHIDQTASNKNVDITPGFDAIALYDYTAEDDDEISFDQGDIITNIDPIDAGWWVGTSASEQRGVFPANYVRVCIKRT
ncbi:tyrosine-protein kinase HCK-like [Ruditapes philippinarum]|uniref:tyrosine-protein kinase HCK-like n=1 Tax=Ruditapes philippinarum TaxID=129788 RepID=UPI00295ADA61|nr:tyrosine-protein kinase HCK-like [Ruditapes philippinarum]